MKKLLIAIAALLLTLAAIVAGALLWLRGATPPLPAHQVYINGVVLTMDADNRVAEAVSVRGERIEAVGTNAEIEALIGADTLVRDLGGRTLLPGFIDAHGHFPGSGLGIMGADLNSPPIGAIDNIPQLQQALRRQLEQQGDRHWLFGFGYDDSQLAEQRHPTRADLDAVSSERPIYIMHISGHMGVANSAALAAAGIDANTPDPAGGVIVRDPATGEPTGLLQEHAVDAVAALAMDFGFLDFVAMADHAGAEYLAAGVTTAQSGGVDSRMLQGLALLSTLKRVPQRLELWPMRSAMGEALLDGSFDASRYQSDKVRVGAVKFITDGSIQGYTGYLALPYHHPHEGDSDYRGYPRLEVDTLNREVQRFHCAGFQIALHGNGDAAIELIIDAFQQAQQHCPRSDARPIIVHAQMARDDQLDAMAELGMTPSFFSAHTYYWGDRHRDIFMGPERAARMSPTRSALQRGLRFSVHLDTPVVPMDPLLLVWSTVNRLSASGAAIGPEQRVDVMTALRAVTIDAAWQIFREGDIGSIEPGKLADLVVLSGDPRAQPEAIRELRVLRTVIGGRSYYTAE